MWQNIFLGLHGDHISYKSPSVAASVQIRAYSDSCGKYVRFAICQAFNEQANPLRDTSPPNAFKKAADLLQKTTLPIQETGSCVGYTDNNYFAIVFNKNFVIMPDL